MKKKVALIIDDSKIKRWQLECLEYCSDIIEVVVVLNCTNTVTKKNIFKHFIYYLINIFLMRNKLTTSVFFNRDIDFLNFKSVYKGNWQSIPSSTLDYMFDFEVDYVVKFGMNLLNIQGSLQNIPVLSFHHGNPQFFRGRPVGFYEILHGVSQVGVVVQSLNNELDAGEFYSFVEVPTVNYSYNKTLINVYDSSKFAFRRALLNIKEKAALSILPSGKIFKLPTNFLSLKLVCLLIKNYLFRIVYGLFFEKSWNINILSNVECDSFFDGNSFKKDLDFYISPPIDDNFSFYADPFFSMCGKKLRCEALHKFYGQGQIVEFDIFQNDMFDSYSKPQVLLKGSHFSFPICFDFNGTEYLLPENSVSNLKLIKVSEIKSDTEMSGDITLLGMEQLNVVDSVIFVHDNVSYIFFSDKSDSCNALHLWYSDKITSTFRPHPLSPIVVSGIGSRMAGKIFVSNNKLYRFGQKNDVVYGESIVVYSILELSSSSYKEEFVTNLAFDNACGPHTIDFSSSQNKVVLDSYSNTFSFFAFVRRLLSKCINMFYKACVS